MNKFWGIAAAGIAVTLGLYWLFSSTKEPVAPVPVKETTELAAAPRPSGPKDEDLIPDPEDMIAKSTAQEAATEEFTQNETTISASGELLIPNAVITELKKCFGSKAGLDSVSSSQDLFTQLGEPVKSRERWVDWSFKTEDGKERRVHWENVEDDSGKIRPTLMVFDLDERGDPVPYPMDTRDQEEPTQEYVDNLLGQGQGVQKETSNLREYAGGVHLEYLEKNGQLKEVEFERDNIFFRCDQVNQANTCHCFN